MKIIMINVGQAITPCQAFYFVDCMRMSEWNASHKMEKTSFFLAPAYTRSKCHRLALRLLITTSMSATTTLVKASMSKFTIDVLPSPSFGMRHHRSRPGGSL